MIIEMDTLQLSRLYMNGYGCLYDYLKSNNVDVNTYIRDKKGITIAADILLHYAHDTTVSKQFIIDFPSIDFNKDIVKGKWKQSIFLVMCSKDDDELAFFMLEYGADPYRSTSGNMTSLSYAIIGHNLRLVRHLLSIGIAFDRLDALLLTNFLNFKDADTLITLFDIIPKDDEIVMFRLFLSVCTDYVSSWSKTKKGSFAQKKKDTFQTLAELLLDYFPKGHDVYTKRDQLGWTLLDTYVENNHDKHSNQVDPKFVCQLIEKGSRVRYDTFNRILRQRNACTSSPHFYHMLELCFSSGIIPRVKDDIMNRLYLDWILCTSQ